MAVELGSAYGKIILDASGATAGAGQAQSALMGLEGGATEAGSSLLGMVTTLTLVGTILAEVGRAAIEAGRETVEAASEEETSLAQLNATIESTGRGAQTSGTQIRAMADDLQGMYDRADIEAAANILMQYLDIPTEQIPQDLVLIQNMAAGLGESLPEAATTFGKAMESGLTHGLGFSKQIQAQINDLMKHGEIAQADQLILDQLNSKYGGQYAAAADTYAGKQDIINSKMQDIKATVGEGLLPTLKELQDVEIGGLDAVERALSTDTQATLEDQLTTLHNQLMQLQQDKTQMEGEGEPSSYIANTQAQIDKVQAAIDRYSLALKENIPLGEADALSAGDLARAMHWAGQEAGSLGDTYMDTGSKQDKFFSSMKEVYSDLISNLGQMDPRTIAVGEAFGFLTDEEITAMVNLHNFDLAIQAWGNKPITKDIVIQLWNATVYGSQAGNPSQMGQQNAPSSSTVQSSGNWTYIGTNVKGFNPGALYWNPTTGQYSIGIPQAEGGDYEVDKPTLFLAGEKGPERATFTPRGKEKEGEKEPSKTYNWYITINNPERKTAEESIDQLMHSMCYLQVAR